MVIKKNGSVMSYGAVKKREQLSFRGDMCAKVILAPVEMIRGVIIEGTSSAERTSIDLCLC